MKTALLIVAIVAYASLVAQASQLTIADLAPVKGDRAVYRVIEESSMIFEGTPVKMASKGIGTQTNDVVAVSKGGRATVYMVLSSQAMKRSQPLNESVTVTSTTYTMETCRISPKGVYVDASLRTEDGEDDSVDLGKRIIQMRLPCTIGTSWRVGRLSYKDGFTIRPESEAVASETVQVPAGTFENCLKVVSTCPQGIEGYLEMDAQRLQILTSYLQVTTWYYPGVGVVKESTRSVMRLRPERQTHVAILRMDTTTNSELTEYKLGKRQD